MNTVAVSREIYGNNDPLPSILVRSNFRMHQIGHYLIFKQWHVKVSLTFLSQPRWWASGQSYCTSGFPPTLTVFSSFYKNNGQQSTNTICLLTEYVPPQIANEFIDILLRCCFGQQYAFSRPVLVDFEFVGPQLIGGVYVFQGIRLVLINIKK